MDYHRIASHLTQGQALQGLKAIVNSGYFGTYVILGQSGISFDTVSKPLNGASKKTSQPATVGDIADVVNRMMTPKKKKKKKTLQQASLNISPSGEAIQRMEFEEGLYDGGNLTLPLRISVTRENGSSQPQYTFRVVHSGFEMAHFNMERLDYHDARRKLSSWYRRITVNMAKALLFKLAN